MSIDNPNPPQPDPFQPATFEPVPVQAQKPKGRSASVLNIALGLAVAVAIAGVAFAAGRGTAPAAAATGNGRAGFGQGGYFGAGNGAGGNGGAGGFGARGTGASITGKVTAVGPDSVTITTSAGTTITVSTSATTTYHQQASGSASDVATGTNLSITVFNPAPGGGTSGARTLAVLNPVPSISSISPSVALALGSSFSLTVNGSGFVSGSVVQVNGSARPTTFVSATQLTAQIANNDILSVGTRAITVFNAAPGGGTSNSATLTVIGLLGQLTAPNIHGLPTALDLKPEPFFSVA